MYRISVLWFVMEARSESMSQPCGKWGTSVSQRYQMCEWLTECGPVFPFSVLGKRGSASVSVTRVSWQVA